MNTLATVIHQSVNQYQTNLISKGLISALQELSPQEKEALLQIQHLLSISPQKLAKKLTELGVAAFWGESGMCQER